jgi:DNA-binding transcriptional regulator PaaX
MASQNTATDAKRLLKALIDRGNLIAPENRITQVAVGMGFNESQSRSALKFAKAEGWLEIAQFGHTKGWFSITPSGRAAAES